MKVDEAIELLRTHKGLAKDPNAHEALDRLIGVVDLWEEEQDARKQVELRLAVVQKALAEYISGITGVDWKKIAKANHLWEVLNNKRLCKESVLLIKPQCPRCASFKDMIGQPG